MDNSSIVKLWVLGSSSKWRRNLFNQYFLSAHFTAVDIDEKAIRHPVAELMTQKIARAKAEAIVGREATEGNGTDDWFKDGVLVCCDEVIRFRGEIREKPETSDQCRAFLRSYRDNPSDYIECVNGVCVYFNCRYLSHYEISRVRFKNLNDAKIEELIKVGDVLGTAGGFVISQMEIEDLVGTVEGVEGLPVKLVRELGTLIADLSKFGNISCCIFGMDGLVIDTEEPYILGHTDACKAFGALFTSELQREILGLEIDVSCQTIVSILALKGVTWKTYRERFISAIEPFLDKCKFIPGVETFLNHVRSLNIPMAIATSSSRKLMRLKIASVQKQIDDVFSSNIICRDDITRSECNSDPNIYLEALRILSEQRTSDGTLPKNETVMVFEASPKGVRVARSLGMNVVMVPHKHLPEDLRNECTLELESLEYLDFSQFIT